MVWEPGFGPVADMIVSHCLVPMAGRVSQQSAPAGRWDSSTKNSWNVLPVRGLAGIRRNALPPRRDQARLELLPERNERCHNHDEEYQHLLRFVCAIRHSSAN